MILNIFDGENTGSYLVNTISSLEFIRISDTFRVSTMPENFEYFNVTNTIQLSV
jgi:hypothetical protein